METTSNTNFSGSRLRRVWLGILVTAAFSVPVVGQPLPATPVRLAGSSVWLDPVIAYTLSSPLQQLSYSFVHQVSYDTQSSGLTLGVELDGSAEAFDDIEVRLEHVSFAAAVPHLGGGSPGDYAGPRTFRSSDGPQPLLTNISNMQVTANIRVTVTLDTRHALSGPRPFQLRYHLY